MAQTTQIRELTATVAGCDVRAATAGDGPPVLVLDHSIADRRWHGVHDALAATFTVHALDIPGFNRSPRPDWARDVRDLAVLVAGYLRKQVGAPALVVGSEFGGWVAAELAVLAPDVVRGLALAGSAGLLPTEGRITDMMLTSHSGYARDCFSSDDAYDAFFEGGLTDERLLAWDFNREMVARVAWKPYMYNRRLLPMLAEVTVPSVVVRGSADRVVPVSCAEQFVALMPNATLEVVEGCGNAVALEQPESLAASVVALAAR
jgi:pimeloyl-ACP methyl ester carboxylesterase